ncbi:MAG: DeoR family transcriptional regulator [Aquificaceae bacterium]|nr:DeoR family transcriptional regulator [Aquificaceae bacterium]MCX8059848.1 DeoR family transcriptional regulator [Aquificaceae bacterium]MDW8096778.1 DeoR family transcriptional regulator [Aquificaceae bacterium]
MSRKEQIVELVAQGLRSVKSLAQHFGVSLMTIYRDVRELEKEGKIVRKHGELLLRHEFSEPIQESIHACAYCTKPVEKRLEFTYRLKSGKLIKACCAHCGLLLYRNLKEEEMQTCMTWDFIGSKPINCFSAWYVVGSSATPCCFPSAIAFMSREEAEKFAKGFGGMVLDFEDALESVEKLMKRGVPVKIEL